MPSLMSGEQVAIITRYFQELTPSQAGQFSQLGELYRSWNEKINVISRKDIEQLYLHHVLHSLSIAKFIQFKGGSKILDVGTGGGFPGISLAILFPEVTFFLADSIGKKIKVVNAIANELKLKNVIAKQVRVEELNEQFDFITGRAVADFSTIYHWTKKLLSKNSFNEKPNGWLMLKGGDVGMGMKHFRYEKIPLDHYFKEEYFKEKWLIYFRNG